MEFVECAGGSASISDKAQWNVANFHPCPDKELNPRISVLGQTSGSHVMSGLQQMTLSVFTNF